MSHKQKTVSERCFTVRVKVFSFRCQLKCRMATFTANSPSISPNTSAESFQLLPSNSTDSIITLLSDPIPSKSKSRPKYHSCSAYKFYNDLPSNIKPLDDIVNLISKYYTPVKYSSCTNSS